jgi:hypothetical protein
MPKRPSQIATRPPLRRELIRKATYVGSQEYKRYKWWGALPDAYDDEDATASKQGRQQTTICPLTTEEDRVAATGWVQAALTAGQMRFYEGDKDFPKHIWYRDKAGGLWFGFCVNSVLGHYKGWPIDEEERLAVFG